jgi:hypothetical protein
MIFARVFTHHGFFFTHYGCTTSPLLFVKRWPTRQPYCCSSFFGALFCWRVKLRTVALTSNIIMRRWYFVPDVTKPALCWLCSWCSSQQRDSTRLYQMEGHRPCSGEGDRGPFGFHEWGMMHSFRDKKKYGQNQTGQFTNLDEGTAGHHSSLR